MKTNLLIRKYDTEPTKGVKTPIEIKSFFGSKLLDIEDDIFINDISIQYSEVVDKINIDNDHYQYYEINPLRPETTITTSLDDVKFQNHSIDIFSVGNRLDNNFEWILNIDVKNILRTYLFLKLKESRVFKTVSSIDLIERNINSYINEYIDASILNRYNVSELAFYATYIKVAGNYDLFAGAAVLRGPNFNKSVFSETNRIKNVNIITPDYLNNLGTVKILFNQTHSVSQYKFDYYFTISYKKI